MVPAARAQSTQRWDYFCFEETGEESVTKKAKAAGVQGWEMVAYGGPPAAILACFKRPL